MLLAGGPPWLAVGGGGRANEVGVVVDAARAFVLRHPRIGAQGTRAGHAAGCIGAAAEFRGDDAVRGNAVFHPPLDGPVDVVARVALRRGGLAEAVGAGAFGRSEEHTSELQSL